MRDALRAELSPMIEDMRRFVDRRIAELSAEVHATVQMVDYSESNLSGQLARIHDQIATMVAMPASATRSSGIELEAVVQATEAAANRIMEAAEAINDWLQDGQHDPESFQSIAERVSTIFEACTFQDVTGQRIRRAIQHLQQVETMLNDMIPAGTNPPEEETLPPPPPEPSADMAQDDVDRLFA